LIAFVAGQHPVDAGILAAEAADHFAGPEIIILKLPSHFGRFNSRGIIFVALILELDEDARNGAMLGHVGRLGVGQPLVEGGGNEGGDGGDEILQGIALVF
jgi:hypothetical protein